MSDQQEFWISSGRIFEHFRFEAFTWWELVLVALVVGALTGYFLFVVLIDRRQKSRLRRQKARTQLAEWLSEWELQPAQRRVLQQMAGERGDLALHRLLADPARFERAVQQAFADRLEVEFTDRVRGFLEYRSTNPRIGVVSTRQLVVGDFLRFSVWEMAQPVHHYGRVISNRPAGLTVQMTDEGWAMVRARAAEAELFFLRDNDFEYPFPLDLHPHVPGENQLLLAHQVIAPGHKPRATRLPLMRATGFLYYTTLPAKAHAKADPSGGWQEQPPRKVSGNLVELSEGGFSAALDGPVTEGGYLEFELPLPRGRTLKVMGRVRGCRKFGGARWLTRCELRGFSPARRGALAQLLRMAWRRRLHFHTAKPNQRSGPGRAS